MHFCIWEKSNGHGKCIEDSGSMHFCIGEEKQRPWRRTKKIQVPCMSAWGKRENGHEEAHRRYRLHACLHGGKINNGNEEALWRFRFYTFLHGEVE